MSRTEGLAAEAQACAYLKKQGLRWLASNYRSRYGEIDLIMQDKQCLVFVEVRARASRAFGGGLASVTYSKQQKLIRTAQFYLMKNTRCQRLAVRFDVLSLDGAPPQIEWVKNAFGSDF